MSLETVPKAPTKIGIYLMLLLLLLPLLLLLLLLLLHTNFNWSMCYSKSLQVSRTLLNILADFNCAVAWIDLILPLISSSASHFSRLLEIIPKAPATIGITVSLKYYYYYYYISVSKVFLLLQSLFHIHF